ncbi:Tripartite motif-containing protein 45 [Mizuhopecten yessoensis]|uniref:Tripartite motif-containing protein 45 n=1 Tax=Mizuhopecten yessoensis TaxID=6573 RepID=A0A210Q4D5_MIZYE|nr:Tripartite motif-containing protein 45 [Mizuhopecten yessoensis]
MASKRQVSKRDAGTVFNITNPSSISLTDMDKSVKCVSCRQFYSKYEHIPHVLPCLHSCCSSCLKKSLRHSKIICPDCQESFQHDGRDTSKFPVDTSKKHMVDLYLIKKTPTEFVCDQCKELATARCRECEEFLCLECSQAHQKTKLTKAHGVISLDKLRTAPLESFHNKPTCQLPGHEGHSLGNFCAKTTCNQPVCRLCVDSSHPESQGHVIRDINDVYVENKRLLEGYLIHLRQQSNSIKHKMSKLEEERKRVKKKDIQADEELEQYFESCTNALENRKKELKTRLQIARENNEENLTNTIVDIQKQHKRVNQACKYAEDHLSHSEAAEFLEVKDPVLQRVYTLSRKDVSKISNPVTCATQFVPRGSADDAMKSIPDVDDVIATSAFLPNTKVETNDICDGKEDSVVTITLFDNQNTLLREKGVNINVTIVDPKGKTWDAKIKDCVESYGCYKALYTPDKPGEHTANVSVCGGHLKAEGYPFYVQKSDELSLDLSEIESSRSTGEKESWISERAMSQKDPELIFPNIDFDSSRCNLQNTVSKNNQRLTNKKSCGPSSRVADHAFVNYRGTISTRPLGKTGQHYFEVQIHLFIKRQLRQELMFEIGLSRKAHIDKHYTVDCHPDAWVFCARRCSICESICLQAWHNNSKLFHTPMTDGKSPGTTFKAIYGFLLDTERQQWFLIDAKSRKCIFRFRNVDTSKPLWPAFAIYNPDLVDVTMTLRSGNGITGEPDVPIDV